MKVKNLFTKSKVLYCTLALVGFFGIENGHAQSYPTLNLKSTVASTNGAEISAYDSSTKKVFTVAGNAIEYYTLSNTGALSAATSIPYGFALASGTTALPNSVAVKNGVLAFSFAIVSSNNAQLPGKVAFYNPETLAYISSVTVGYLPDMLSFSPDGTKILTANEGEPNSYNQADSFDPEGSVSVIDITNGIANATVATASFTAYNSQKDALKASGIRVFGPNATVAQDFEPEYIAFYDNTKAAVTLQENNAVAIIDIASATVTNVYPLGLKDHSLAGNGFDASDRDLTSSTGKINIQNWPVKGMFMPDAIASFTSGGNTYFITANEGDSRDYKGFGEEVRVGASAYVLDATVFPNGSTLKNNANLGRLQLTNASGDTDGDGDFDEIHAFGARSFTIWNSTFGQVFDSGDQLEQITASQSASSFNSDGLPGSFDTRSDNKGPEPEAVTTGMVNGVMYAFVGSERTGDIFVYDVSNPTTPVFKQYLNSVTDTGVEGLIFIPANQSPTGKPLVISSAEVSKTVSVYEFTAPTIEATVGTIACHGGKTSVTITATEGKAPYTGTGTFIVSAGTHTYTVTDADGFVATKTIVVTEPEMLTTTETVVACSNEYTWAANGVTYTQEGTYTYTEIPSEGCEVLKTLILTLSEHFVNDDETPFICNTTGATTSISLPTNAVNAKYTWQSRVVTAANPNPTWANLANNANYSGVDSSILTITKTSAAFPTGIQFRLLVKGQCDEFTSKTMPLNVVGVTKSGVISAPSSVCTGGNITLSLGNYSGTSVQWQSAPTNTGVFTDIVGATNASLELNNVNPSINKAYRAVVSNSCGAAPATSGVKVITVNAASVAGTATGGGLVCYYGSGTLKLSGYVGNIQWEYSLDNGANFNLAPRSSDVSFNGFTTTSVSSNSYIYNIGNITSPIQFRARVTSGVCSSEYSNVLYFDLRKDVVAGNLTADDTSICAATGTSLNLLNAEGTVTWQKSINYTALTPTWTNVVNASATTLSTGNLSVSTAYRAMVSIGSCLTAYSNVVVVAIEARPVSKPIVANVTSPSGTSSGFAICNTDKSKTLTIGAGAVGNIQWQTSTSATTGFADVAGENGMSYTITNPQVGANYYRAIFSNDCGVSVAGVAFRVYYKSCFAPGRYDNLVSDSNAFEAKAYPNPFTASFSLNLTTNSDEKVNVYVYDMTGRLLEQSEVNPSVLEDQEFGAQYPTGIYNVVVNQNDEVRTIKVVKP